MSVIIKNGMIIYGDEFTIVRSDVLIEDGVIKEVGKNIRAPADMVIDASSHLVIPGLINAHTHVSMVLLRGLAEDVPLQEWLQNYIWPRERELKRKDIYWGTLLGLVEMARSGVTTFVDMYFHIEEVAKATIEVGLRGFLGYGMVDLENREKLEVEIKETEKFYEYVTKINSPLVNFVLAPHAPYTCSLECLKWVSKKANQWNVPVTIHLSETKKEVEEIRKKYGMTPTQLLDEVGLLNEKLIAAHGVWLSEEELRMLSSANATVVHCPASNMKLGSGVFPLRKALDLGVNVALGTDGAASNNTLDMLREMRLASLLQKVAHLNPAIVKSEEILKMATVNPAKALGLKSGVIKEGYIADLALINLRRPHLLPLNSPTSLLIYSARGGDVDTLFVNGEIVILDGEFLTVNEEKILDKFLKVIE
ncbi:MAG: 5-methylthioadenosine/S-adenosylhomocysteine deaminase [Pyrococcus sp.]|nr:5-methylthioadenosine/S-adenosylhomocysteine deaminase [Pyrococcus sp.]